jgi:hypothetical protein
MKLLTLVLINIGFLLTGCGPTSAQLSIASIEVLGDVEISSEGLFLVPLRVKVSNSGNFPANTSKVVVFYTAEDGVEKAAPFHVPGYAGDYPFTGDILIGKSVTLEGKVLLSMALHSQEISLRAKADSCYDDVITDEFMQKYCRVREGEGGENNNFSDPVEVQMPYPS